MPKINDEQFLAIEEALRLMEESWSTTSVAEARKVQRILADKIGLGDTEIISAVQYPEETLQLVEGPAGGGVELGWDVASAGPPYESAVRDEICASTTLDERLNSFGLIPELHQAKAFRDRVNAGAQTDWDPHPFVIWYLVLEE